MVEKRLLRTRTDSNYGRLCEDPTLNLTMPGRSCAIQKIQNPGITDHETSTPYPVLGI